MAESPAHHAGAAGVAHHASGRLARDGSRLLDHLGLGVGFNGLAGVEPAVNQPVVGFEIVGQVIECESACAQVIGFQGWAARRWWPPTDEAGGELGQGALGSSSL